MILYTFPELKSEFDLALKQAHSKSFLIDNEISQIHKLLNYDPAEKYRRKGLAKYAIKPKAKRVFKIDLKTSDIYLFKEAFHSYSELGSFDLKPFPDESESSYTHREEIAKQAREFKDYYNWLSGLKSNPKTEDVKLNSLTNKQKVLALHYLGLQFKDHDYSQVARMIEPIINVGWKDSRKYVQILVHEDQNIKTRENLNSILHLFDKENFTEQTKKIKLDLEKLN